MLADGIVKEEYFEDPIDSVIAAHVISLYHELGAAPTPRIVVESLQEEFSKEEFSLYFKRLRKIAKLNVTESEARFIEAELRNFTGIQQLKIAINKSISPLKYGDLEKVKAILQDAISSTERDTFLREVDFFGSAEERIAPKDEKEIRAKTVKTLISDLDKVLRNGGITKSEVAVILAVPNKGKTMALCHMAKAAIIQRKNVVYASIDDSADIITERLEGSFTGIRLNDLQDNRLKVYKQLVKLGKAYGSSLIIKEFLAGTSLHAVDAYLRKLASQGFRPDVLVLDYVNLLSSRESRSRQSDGRYMELGNIFQGLKRLSKERDLVIWTAAQSNRSGMTKEVVTSAEIAESFEGIMAANVIVSLNQTPEEKRREAMRLFLAKNKTSLAEVIVKINTNFAKGTFYRKIAT